MPHMKAVAHPFDDDGSHYAVLDGLAFVHGAKAAGGQLAALEQLVLRTSATRMSF